MTLSVRPISPAEHLEFLNGPGAAAGSSFLQVPSWAGVKAEWDSTDLGWFLPNGELVGTALVLLRQVPKLPRYLAYLPEGPNIDWFGENPKTEGYTLADWLDPMLAHLKSAGAFAVKMGPQVAVRRWSATTLKDAIASADETGVRRLKDVTADDTDGRAGALVDRLQVMGWTQRVDEGAGFGDVQPRYVFQVPLAGRSEEDLLTGFNQLWRRNIKKAEKSGVVVESAGRDGLAEFHPVYVETAARDGFTPRGLAYFERMWDAMAAEDPERIRCYLARHEGRVLAATTLVKVGRHAWYSYGASSNEGREFRPSNAIQWQMIRDSLAEGCSVYDLRGISDTLDPKDPLFGLIQFKLGTGGHALEYVGEWDFALRPVMNKAFEAYMKRR